MSTAEIGRSFVEKELIRLGAAVHIEKRGNMFRFHSSNPNETRNVEIRVKTKTGNGNWHSDIKEGRSIDPIPDLVKETAFWIFVDLNNYAVAPNYFVVPDSWMRNNIDVTHKEYIRKYGGKRKKNDKSTHHSINRERISDWENRWDLIGL